MPPATEPKEKRPFPRWPLVGLVVVLAGLAAFWKEDLNSKKSHLERAREKNEQAEAINLQNTHATSDNAVSFIQEVEEALTERGIGLTLVAMPYREDLYPVRSAPLEDLIPRPGFNAMVAWTALQRLRHDGTQTIDLWDEFYDAAGLGDIYKDDLCHLEKPIEKEIGISLLGMLSEEGVFEENASGVTVLGECFAETFGEVFRDQLGLTSDELLVLRGSADRGRMPNQLFRFDEVYLADCKHVIWIAPYILFRQESFPPLVINPAPVSGDMVELNVTVRLTDELDFGFEEMKKVVQTMPYENALAELSFEQLEGETLPEKKGIFVAWAARQRMRSGLEHLRPGDVIHAKLHDWNSYVESNPSIVGEYFLEQKDDYDSRRYWLSDWVQQVD